MFIVKVEDAMIKNEIITFGGPCENRKDYTTRLTDESGNIYETYVPTEKGLVFDASRIVLCMKGEHDIKSLIGRTLSGAGEAEG